MYNFGTQSEPNLLSDGWKYPFFFHLFCGLFKLQNPTQQVTINIPEILHS